MDNTATVIEDSAEALLAFLSGDIEGGSVDTVEAIASCFGIQCPSLPALIAAIIAHVKANPMTPEQEASVQEILRNRH